MKIKLAIISSHPIQYNAPLFALLTQSEVLEVRVFYSWSQSKDSLFDKDFGKTIQWDIPLLNGYQYEFADNVSKNPGLTSFRGIICPGLNRSIREWGADALLVYGWNYHAHYHAMRHFKGKIPVFFRGDSTLIDETGGPKQFLRRMILRYVYSHVDFAFYVGENSRKYFLKHGFNHEHLFFAPHAIDNHRFSDPNGEMRHEAEKLRDSLGIGKEDIVVVFAGKFESKKNPLLLLEAAMRLNKPGVHYIFTGNGILEKQMKQIAAANHAVHFLPFQNQSRMPAIYYAGDILALPSQGPGETWGLVVNEAMACGRAVLVSDKSGCAPDLVKPGVNGFIMPSGDLDRCIELLDIMTVSRTYTRQLGDASLKHIAGWSFNAVCKSFEFNIPRSV